MVYLALYIRDIFSSASVYMDSSVSTVAVNHVTDSTCFYPLLHEWELEGSRCTIEFCRPAIFFVVLLRFVAYIFAIYVARRQKPLALSYDILQIGPISEQI